MSNRFSHLQAIASAFPPFRPLPLLGGPNAQTIGATYLSRCPTLDGTVQQHVRLPDDDILVVHDDQPRGWQATDPVAILVHGLSGCHASAYMARAATKLVRAGVRTFRLDSRGCGAGWALAKHSLHAGRGDDVLAAVEAVAETCPGAPLGVVGFSLGGLLTLRALVDHPARTNRLLKSAMAVSPPADLTLCSHALRQPRNRIYNRTMGRWLYRYVRQRRESNPAVARYDTGRCPTGVYAFDEQFTAPLAGFESAESYYSSETIIHRLDQIQVPTLVLVAEDDPLIPYKMFAGTRFSDSTTLYTSPRGGHVGYLGRRGNDPDRWWLDWRIVDWVVAGCKLGLDA